MEQLMDLHQLVGAVVPSIHKARQTQINQFANVSRIALLVYDFFLNLDREKRLVWEAKFGLSSILYYVLRYPVIAFQIFNVFLSPTLPQVGGLLYPVPLFDRLINIASYCDALYKLTFTISITLTRIALCASFILRIYAILPRGIGRYSACALLSAIGMLSVVLDVVQTIDQSCTQSSSLSLVLTFICLICFDVVSTVLMLWGIYCLLKDENEGLQAMRIRRTRRKWRLPAIIVRSGILYYLAITGLQIGSVILYWLPQGVYSLVLNYYLTTLSTILVSRFLLDLREYVNKDQSYLSDLPSQAQGIRFAVPIVNDGHSRTLAARWLEDFEFETCSFPKTEGYMEPESTLNSMACPLEDLIDRRRRAEERLVEEVGDISVGQSVNGESHPSFAM